MSTVDMNRGVLISSRFLFDTAAFKSKFNFLEVSVKRFIECVATAAATATKEFLESME